VANVATQQQFMMRSQQRIPGDCTAWQISPSAESAEIQPPPTLNVKALKEQTIPTKIVRRRKSQLMNSNKKLAPYRNDSRLFASYVSAKFKLT